MATRKRILVLNNYPLDVVWEEVKAGLKPANHLYGIDFLEKVGYEVVIVPFKRNKILVKFSNWLEKVLPIPFGDLDQQWSALKMIKECDIIYAPCQTQTWVLSYFRKLGLIRKPIVVLAHHPFEKGRLAVFRRPFLRLSFSGVDAYPAISSEVSNEINRISKKALSEILFWGPQLDFFGTNDAMGEKILVSGRTGRDFLTFGRAASKTNIPCKIVCIKRDYKKDFLSFTDNVEVEVNDKMISYKELARTYQEARVIAIPFVNWKKLCGLTSLTDALALGKPIIMTKSEYIDIDLEKEKIGIWIDNYDENGWMNAINKLGNDYKLASEMGKRARKLAEEKYSYDAFCLKIKQILEGVMSK